MTYERAGPRFRALGMFVGSGAVEAGYKAIGQRLEQSCTHRSLPGAAAIITLRCRQASGRWEDLEAAPQPAECGMTRHLSTSAHSDNRRPSPPEPGHLQN